MAAKENKGMTAFRLKRFGLFVKKLLKTWQGALGLGLIMMFVVVAVFAQFIVPYTSTGQDPNNADRLLAGDRAAPSWLRSVPTFLGGNPRLSENLEFIKNPGLPKLKEWGVDGEWYFEADQGFSCDQSDIGYPAENKIGWFRQTPRNGSIAIEYSRGSSTSPNATFVATLFSRTYFPYGGYPRRWSANFEAKVVGTSNGSLAVPMTLRVFIQPENGQRFTLWRQDFTTPTSHLSEWVFPQISRESSVSYMDSRAAEIGYVEPRFAIPNDPLIVAFTETPGTYLYGVEIYMNDTKGYAASAYTRIYLDDLSFDTLGNSWGVLGTDHMGRDIFSQLVYGTRISLYVGLLVSVLSVVIGLTVGLASGYVGGALDQITMRVNDLLLVLPGLPFLIVLIAVMGAKLENLIIFMGLLGWNGFARVVRSQTLSLRERPFVEAAKAAGASTSHIITSHILPNVMALVYITLASSVPGAVTAEAALSYLGFFDPQRMSWGRMLREVTDAGAVTAWWWILPPGLLISVLAVAFILLGFGLDDVLNPKLRVRR
jgi:ABC-type dipeptide/oligopeptide/nickel transport system permease subunit